MLQKMKILILTGGNSSERKISLTSARNVKKALKDNGHKVKLYDLRKGYDPIIKLSEKYDILFPVLHGEEGEGGTLHKYLSAVNKPIVGTKNYEGMKKAWYKIPFKEYCDSRNIPTAKWEIVKKDSKLLNFPFVLKDSSGGSSREVMIIKSKKDLNKNQAKNILNSGNTFIEEYLTGTEITVGVLNNKALPVLEIVPANDTWFSYKTKYDGSTKEIPFAPSVDPKIQKEAQKTALKIHQNFNLGTYSRTDFIVRNSIPFALEINTIPGLTSESLMPKAAKAAGFNFNKFLEILVSKAR